MLQMLNVLCISLHQRTKTAITLSPHLKSLITIAYLWLRSSTDMHHDWHTCGLLAEQLFSVGFL